jgi:hypothetical protein
MEDMLKFSRFEVEDVRERVSLQGKASSELHQAAESWAEADSGAGSHVEYQIRGHCEIKNCFLVLLIE